MKEIERRLIADAALSRWATGNDKSFVASYEHPEEQMMPEFNSAEEADAFLGVHKEMIDWVYNNLDNILTDAIYRHERR